MTVFFLVSDVYNYFRAILLSQEMSQRALELVTDAIALNPANYTAWVHRYVICNTVFLLNNNFFSEMYNLYKLA